LRACHPHAVTVEAVIDLGDPGATGMLWSALGPWAGALRSRPWGSVDLRPGFQDDGMALRGRGRYTVVPVEVLVIVVAFVLSPAVMRAGWTLAGGGRS
ncbi:MAG TPA: hypothetical protein VGG33_02375, partial [Polyangia bacterium]